MDGATDIPSTLTSKFDNMHIFDKEKDPSHEANCPSYSDKVDDESVLNAMRIQHAKICLSSGPDNPHVRAKILRKEWEEIKDRFMNDPEFRKMNFWYGESSDDSDMDAEDMDDSDMDAEE